MCNKTGSIRSRYYHTCKPSIMQMFSKKWPNWTTKQFSLGCKIEKKNKKIIIIISEKPIYYLFKRVKKFCEGKILFNQNIYMEVGMTIRIRKENSFFLLLIGWTIKISFLEECGKHQLIRSFFEIINFN